MVSTRSTAPAQAQAGEFSPNNPQCRRGRKAIHSDSAARQRAYRARLRATKPVQPQKPKTMNDLVAAVCREHNDYRGIFLIDAPKGMGKLIYMGGIGAHEDIANVSDRQQVQEM